MIDFLFCFGHCLLCTLLIPVLCALLVEGCYRLCFRLMGARAARLFWRITSPVGTPIHECGHALMCLLFAHRIEKIRLVPTRAGGAVVEHSYRRKNPYAVLGNIMIGLGPILLGFGVMVGLLGVAYPQTVRALVGAGTAFPTLLGTLFEGLWREDTRPLWVRLLCITLVLLVSLHMRLSRADVRGMAVGLPLYTMLVAAVAGVFVLIGKQAAEVFLFAMRQFAHWMLILFGLILCAALALLLVVALIRLIVWLFGRR